VARSRLLTATLFAGLLLAGPVGAAAADGETDVDPSPTVAAANQPPVANPDAAAVDAGRSVRIDVLANDTDDGLGRPEGEEPRLEVVHVSGGDGRLSHDGDSVTFEARPSDSGTYTVRYQVSDGELKDVGDIVVKVAAVARRTVSIYLKKGVVALRTYSIHGRIRPRVAGPAKVVVQRRTPNGWVRHAVDRTNARGGYAVRFRTDKLGKRTFRAKAVFKDGRTARSGSITRTVVARADVKVSGPLARKQVRWSWRSGCPVPPRELRKITINRYDYRKRISRGTVVVRAGAVKDVVAVLKGAIGKRFPIRMMKPTDAFYAGGRRTPTASDKASMRAGNTSAFNCRPVVGNPYRVSQHSYGNAIDINTIENPYVVGSRVYPKGSRSYLDRSPYRRGMILRGGVIASRMSARGWLWGARWSHPDYQHFSSNGG
jgi:hypothetical protein